jgi:hypothetical protein
MRKLRQKKNGIKHCSFRRTELHLWHDLQNQVGSGSLSAKLILSQSAPQTRACFKSTKRTLCAREFSADQKQFHLQTRVFWVRRTDHFAEGNLIKIQPSKFH